MMRELSITVTIKRDARPFIDFNTIQHTVNYFGSFPSHEAPQLHIAPRRDFAIAHQTVYQGPILTMNQYQFRLPDGQKLVRDIVERPDSVLIVPVGDDDIVLLVEEYNLGAGLWQLTLPGGNVDRTDGVSLEEQDQRELRQEMGYQAGRLEKLIEWSGQPGYMLHHVHVFVAFDLHWNPLELETHEEIRLHTSHLKEALQPTLLDHRTDPETAQALWLFAHTSGASRRFFSGTGPNIRLVR